MTDPFEHDDAAYVLGSLSPDEAAAFEAHLAGCAACTARVAEIADLPRLLDGINPDELAEPSPDPVPDTLLPRLVREIGHERRRRTLRAGAAALVAACVAAVITVFATGTGSPAPHPAALSGARPMHPLVNTSVQAQVALTAEQWGTRVTLHCRYGRQAGREYEYDMAAVGPHGEHYSLGGWHIAGGQQLTYVAGVPLARRQISAIVVTTADGLPILRLAT